MPGTVIIFLLAAVSVGFLLYFVFSLYRDDHHARKRAWRLGSRVRRWWE